MRIKNILSGIWVAIKRGASGVRHALWVARYYIVSAVVTLSLFTYLISDLIVNWAFYFRFLNDLIILLVYIFVLLVKQVRETLVPWDVYTRLRIYILTLLTIGFITIAPSVAYQWLISIGYESQVLRNIITLIGAINRDTTTILLVMVFYYRIRR